MISAYFLLAATVYTLTSAASISSNDVFCLHEGAKFYPGEKVVLQECQYTCQCAASEEYSFFMCEPLCTRPYDFMCANGADPVEKMEESSVPGCKCPKYYCPETLSMAHLIDHGIVDGYFEPDLNVEADDLSMDDAQYIE